jgi:hypothetical protein
MTWTAPQITRVNRPFAEPVGDERTWLDLQRQTLLWKCGRGLTVVAALSDRWGSKRTGRSRKVVWADLALSAPPPV